MVARGQHRGARARGYGKWTVRFRGLRQSPTRLRRWTHGSDLHTGSARVSERKHQRTRQRTGQRLRVHPPQPAAQLVAPVHPFCPVQFGAAVRFCRANSRPGARPWISSGRARDSDSNHGDCPDHASRPTGGRVHHKLGLADGRIAQGRGHRPHGWQVHRWGYPARPTGANVEHRNAVRDRRHVRLRPAIWGGLEDVQAVAQLQEREPEASRLELPYGERQEGLQKQHDTLNVGGSIGLRSVVPQVLKRAGGPTPPGGQLRP